MLYCDRVVLLRWATLSWLGKMLPAIVTLSHSCPSMINSSPFFTYFAFGGMLIVMPHHRKTPKPWARDSPNPLTGRTNATSNGVQVPNKSSPSPRITPTPTKETFSLEKHANDRLMFLFANFVVRTLVRLPVTDKFRFI